MPRWRPLGISKAELFAQDGNDCALKIVGKCVIPHLPATAGAEFSNSPSALSLDHIREQCRFGSDHRPENLLTVHRVCNQVRGPKPFIRFVGREGARRIAQRYPRVAPTIRECLGV